LSREIEVKDVYPEKPPSSSEIPDLDRVIEVIDVDPESIFYPGK
jgi:hypothetical protein